MVSAQSDLINRRGGLFMTIRGFVAAGALAVAAVAAPIAGAFVGAGVDQPMANNGKCLAYFGNQEDGQCLGYSNGQPIVGSTPGGLYGPNTGVGVQTGQLLPGQTWTSSTGN
jgi:hypothetical protein